MGTCDVVISEDVWGEPFDELASELAIVADPDLWSHRSRLVDQLRQARALVVRNRTRVDAELIRTAPNLKIIARAGVGLDNIDLGAAEEHGVVVVSPRGANSRSVAEYTVGAAVVLMRGLIAHDHSVRSGRWNRHAGRELGGRTWGILGAGSTGSAVAHLAHGFGMTILGYDPYVEPDRADLVAAGVTLATLEAVCAESDVVSIHLPRTAGTTGLVDRRLLKLMGPRTCLINVARGEVLDEQALAELLETGELGGAALDVRATEPPILGKLEQLTNVLLTPHIAGITEESEARIAAALVEDIRVVLSGGVARCAVTRKVS